MRYTHFFCQSILLWATFSPSNICAKIPPYVPVLKNIDRVQPKFYLGMGLAGQHAEHNYAFSDRGDDFGNIKTRNFHYVSEISTGLRLYFPSQTFVGIGLETRLGTHKLEKEFGNYSNTDPLEEQPAKLIVEKNQDSEVNIQLGTDFFSGRIYGKIGLGFAFINYRHVPSDPAHYKSGINNKLFTMYFSPGFGIEKQLAENCTFGISFSVPICKQNNSQQKRIIPGTDPIQKEYDPATLSKIAGRTTYYQIGINFKFEI